MLLASVGHFEWSRVINFVVVISAYVGGVYMILILRA
jgi:hypothetical protein